MNFSFVKKYSVYFFVSVLIALGFIWLFSVAATVDFPSNSYFEIKSGESLAEISDSLYKSGIIRSPLIFRAIVSVVLRSGNDAVAGNYFFEKPLDAFEIGERIIHGTLVSGPIKITIPEGLNKYEIAALIKKSIPVFDALAFTSQAEEGYIFPDTYFFPEKVSSYDVIRIARENFNQNIKSLRDKIAESGKSFTDIIKMASIVELEANKSDARRIIAGILWRRIEINMPLQVDVSFKYVNGKRGTEITAADLKIDSLYNSYKYTGLPPTPISNPGLSAIEAVVMPEKTKYLYYISDKTGAMHYAVTFDEHKRNKAKYLK